jgi:hypothetical protein
MIRILLVGIFMLLAMSMGYEYFHLDHYVCMRNPEYLDSQSRITWTVKRQHLDTSPAHLDS